MSLTPTVAIVGRPNVGKSTLFNRLLGKRQAIVHKRPGVTRDRLTGVAALDDGRSVQLIDTGGLVPGKDGLRLNEQVHLAVKESDFLLLVVDGKEGLLPADEEVWQELRAYGKPTLLVVNKGDVKRAQDHFPEFYRLGIKRQILISAEHGGGVQDLRQALALGLPELSVPQMPEAPAVAIVGRPNVGKSSLLNRITGEDRVLVSPVPGTTRDPVDTVVSHDGRSYLLIDTAGIRRRSRVSGTPEELAVMMARRQIERARLAILVVDVTAGITSADLAIAGAIWDVGRAAVVAVNKWDLVQDETHHRLEEEWPRLRDLLGSAPRVNVSAVSGRGIEKLFAAVERTLGAFETRLSTGETNRIFERAVASHHPPSQGGRPWKLYYATQVSTAPPTFMVFANRTLPRRHAYRRYLENRLRDALQVPGVPLRLVIRRR